MPRFPTVRIPGLNRDIGRIMLAARPFPQEPHAATLDRFLAVGGNAIHLHGEGGETLSREAVGAWMQDRQTREQVVLCSQICHDGWDEATQTEFDRLTPEGIEEDISHDLALLQTNALDVVYLSCDMPTTPVAAILESLAEQWQRGRIHAYGVRNWSAERILEANAYARLRGIPGFSVLVTTELSLGVPVEPTWPDYVPFAEQRECVRAQNLAVFAWVSDFNHGLFVPEAARSALPYAERVYARWCSDENMALLKRAQTLAQRKGMDARQINVAAILQQPFPVVGIMTQRESAATPLETYLDACHLTLSQDDLATLEGTSAAP